MENIGILILGLLISVIAGSIILPNILVISYRKKLYDVPDERKIHTTPVPRLGGVCFFPVIVFVICTMSVLWMTRGVESQSIFAYRIVKEMICLTAGLTLLYIVGIADDLVGVRYREKFVVQIMAASLFPLAGLYINNFYGLFGIFSIPSFIGIPLTMLLVVFITNSINLIDGIDGLASGLCMVALGIFGMIFLIQEMWLFALLSLVSFGVLIPFYRFNVFGKADRKRKIFMGDTGSLTLGYILSFLVIEFCRHRGIETAPTDGAPIVIAFSILLVPSLDVCRVVLGRARRKVNLFMPDKTHIHHKFLNMGYTAAGALTWILCMSIAFIAFTIGAIRIGLNANIVLVLDICIWIVIHLILTRIIVKKEIKGDKGR